MEPSAEPSIDLGLASGWAPPFEFTGWICPLTPLEDGLCEKGGQSAGLVEHHLLPSSTRAMPERRPQALLDGSSRVGQVSVGVSQASSNRALR